jgi:hypothetical protein
MSQFASEISQLPVFVDAVPDTQGCPCPPMELRVVSVSVQLGTPENTRIAAGRVKISQPMCNISQLPVFVDAVPDTQGCPCLPTELRVVSVSVQLGTPENIRIAVGIVKILQLVCQI